MVNDTILNTRQEQILKLLKQRPEMSRSEMAGLISSKKTISRITLIRDLNGLMKQELVSAKGKGKARVYSLTQDSPLLEYVNIDNYFELDIDKRGAKKDFNPGVFNKLSSPYSKGEVLLWEESAKEFRERIGKLDKSIYKRELERFVIEFSWKSSQIEGNTYDLLETETLIKENIEAKGHSKEEAVMILNHKDAFERVLNKKGGFTRLTFSDVTQLHGVLTKGLVSSGIRSQPVQISGTIYSPMQNSHDIESALTRLVTLINKTPFPPEKALIAACMIAYIQPFADGNKRTARMLANGILLAHGYFPLSYRNVDVNEYRKALILFYEQNNLYHFKRIFIEQLEFATQNYFRI